MSAHQILITAANTLLGRAADRDIEQERSMQRIVKCFNAASGHSISERDGWLFMVCLKLCRATTTAVGKEDDYVDGAAYFALAGESVENVNV
jgi:hypothetical protein